VEDAVRDRAIVERLRGGDEAAFRELVQRHHASMVRFAETFVPSRAVAEEVAQEAWVGVIKGIGGFEGRSLLSTWIFRIVANIGRSRGARERRTAPVSTLEQELAETAGPSVAARRFSGPTGQGEWAQPPARWSDVPDERLLSQLTIERVSSLAAQLSENQRRVFTLRDVEGYTSVEVCELLELSEVNQRVLLHRARSRIRAALEQEMEVRS